MINRKSAVSSVVSVCFIVLSSLFFMINCSGQSDLIEITERMFIGQVNEIYANPGDYLGKTVKLEGIFKMYDAGDAIYYHVVRYGLDPCCGDANIGFEVVLSGDEDPPEPDSWVLATGILKTEQVNDFFSFLYLDLSSLTVLNERGAEFVRQ